MTNDPLERQFRELNWRRPLTAVEQARLRAWLETHPEAQADWATDAALTEAFERLPNVPVPSNFTARVLEAAERETARGQSSSRLSQRLWPWRLAWLTRAAVAALVLSTGLATFHHVRTIQVRQERAESLQKLIAASGISSVTEPEILENFDTIRTLNRPIADDELLQLLK
jgi:anti-sigma factor RsiW